jgi:signal transduction histidine kinase
MNDVFVSLVSTAFLFVLVVALSVAWLRERRLRRLDAEALAANKEELKRSNAIAEAGASLLSVREIAKAFLSTLQEHFAFDEAGVQLIADDNGKFTYFEAVGFASQEILRALESAPIIRVNDNPPISLASLAVRERRTLYFPRSRPDDLLPYERLLFDVKPWTSLLMIPMEAMGVVVGCAVFTSQYAPFELSVEKLAGIERAVRQFAGVVVSAQQRYRLQQAHGRIEEQMTALAAQKNAAEIAALEVEMVELFARVINRESAFEPLLHAMLYQIGYLIPRAEKGSVALFDAADRTFRFVVLAGYSYDDFADITLNYEETLERYFRHEEPVADGVYYLRKFLLRNYETSVGERFGDIPLPECSLALTLEVGGEVAGLLFLDNFERNDIFSSDDVARAARLREHINSALCKAIDIQRLERQRAEIASSYKNLETLSHIGRHIASTLDLEKALHLLYDYVNRIMDATSFGVGLYVPQRNVLRFELTVYNGELLPPYERPIAEKGFFSMWSFQQGQELLIGDVDTEYQPYISSLEEYKAGQMAKFGDYMRSLISVPLSTFDNTVGVMVAQSHRKHAYTPRHLDMFRSIASYAAAALANADSYREIRRQQTILEDQATEIELTNATLHETNMRLMELDREKDEFLGIVAHDLKNPLAGIMTITGMLRRYRAKMDEPQIDEQLLKIERAAARMNESIVNILTVNALERGALALEPSPEARELAPILRAVLEQYAERAQAKGIAILADYGESGIAAFAREEALTSVFDNLVSNAVKYSPHGARVWVRLSADGEKARFEVADEGPGVADEEVPKLFGKFVRLSARPTGGEHSSGLGLSIVQKIVQAVGGRVWYEPSRASGANAFDDRASGAKFIVELPRADFRTA